MVAPAASQAQRGRNFRVSRRSCHVCSTVIPSGKEATKIVRADGVAGGAIRTLFWFCEQHSKLFLDVLNWEDE